MHSFPVAQAPHGEPEEEDEHPPGTSAAQSSTTIHENRNRG